MDNLEAIKKLIEDAQKEKACPSCGRCPTCGRGAWPNGTWEWKPPQPWSPPVVYYMNDAGTAISSNSLVFNG